MASVLRNTARLTVPSLRHGVVRPTLRAASRALATQTVRFSSTLNHLRH